MSSVCRAAVRIDKNGFLVREIFGKARLNRPDNMSDRVSIVKARDANQDICLSDFPELFADLIS